MSTSFVQAEHEKGPTHACGEAHDVCVYATHVGCSRSVGVCVCESVWHARIKPCVVLYVRAR